MSSYFEFGETTGMKGLANRLGLRYCATTADRGYQDDVGELPRVGLLADGPQPVADLMYGRHDDANIQVFKYLLSAYPGEPGHPMRSCVAITFAADFPPFALEPHNRMSQLRLKANREWLDFAPDQFRQRFSVSTVDNATARSILSDEVLHWLMSGREDIRIEIEDGALVGHTRLLGDDDPGWMELIDYVVGFHHMIPRQAWIDYSLFRSL